MLKIVFEHSARLPVDKYGGTERLIFWKMRELHKRGAKVSYIGHPESRLSEYGINLIPRAKGVDWRALVPKDTDIVHLTATPLKEVDCPVIITIGGNGQEGEAFHLNTVFISKNHAKHHGSQIFVYNGIDLNEYPFPKNKKTIHWNNFLFLAKAKWRVKNLKDCVKACKKAKKILHIAGGRAWSLSRYIKSYGMVDQNKKIALLSATDALLNPVKWHEPFGISMIEAFAMGLPVIGSKHGSLSEIIHPDTGMICGNYDEFLESVSSKPREFNPFLIRNYVENSFSISKTIENYLPLYEKVISGKTLHTQNPETQKGFLAQKLLTF